jgi:uridine kinase
MSNLIQAIRALRPRGRRTVLVAIDGRGGAGKSTLANLIAARLPNVTTVRTDDFTRPRVTGWDWRRLKEEVLEPLARDRPGRYRRHDWGTDAPAEWHDVPVGGLVVVEGVGAMRSELGRYWDRAIWVECGRALRLERGVARDGEAMRAQWTNVWMPEEDRYVRRDRPRARADHVVSGERPYEP